MKTFDELLAENHLGFTPLWDEKTDDRLRALWEAIVEKEHGQVSDAKIDSILSFYKNSGVIADLDSPYMMNKKEEPKPVQPENKEKPAAPRVFYSASQTASPEHPLLILKNDDGLLVHHVNGDFTNPKRRHAFEFPQGGSEHLEVRDILAIDSRFKKILNWLGEGHVSVRLSGRPVEEGFAVYKIHATDQVRANDSFLQFVLHRLQEAPPVHPAENEKMPGEAPEDPDLILSDLTSITTFLKTASETLPPDISRWAFRNMAMAKSDTLSPEEKRHAQRALSLMLKVQWESSYFPSVDPEEARKILDEELYGLENVKQRVIETIIQINRTHTLPAYGLLLVGPAGTGKSQIAYAVARILKLPWMSLDMSTIHDPQALTGTPRVYSNAKPGRIMEAFSQAGSSNMVLIINELDKADSTTSAGSPADALLTLLDGLGFTDNYMECAIPTSGIYAIATANDKSRISNPLLSRFAIIDLPDYTPAEKKVIFTDYCLPRVLKRLGMRTEECTVTEEGVQVILKRFEDRTGVRDLQQAAEHLAAHALYEIETTGIPAVVYDGRTAGEVLGR